MKTKQGKKIIREFVKEFAVKKYVYYLIAVFILLQMFGCSTNEEMDDCSEKENKVIYSTEKVSTEDHNYIYYGTMKQFDEESVIAAFSMNNEMYEKDDNMGNSEAESWTGNKGGYIYLEPGYINYTAEEYNNNYDFLIWDEGGRVRSDFEELTSSISGIHEYTREEAIEDVLKIVETLGIKYNNVNAYPLDKELLGKLSRNYISDEEWEKTDVSDRENIKRDFEESDEVYLVRMTPVIQDNILHNKSYTYGERGYKGADIWSLVKKDKIVSFYAESIYVSNGENKQVEKLLSLDEANEKLKDKYEDYFLEGDISCNEIKMEYLAICSDGENLYEFIPVYEFVIDYSVKDEKDKNRVIDISECLLLDATNGVWIE